MSKISKVTFHSDGVMTIIDDYGWESTYSTRGITQLDNNDIQLPVVVLSMLVAELMDRIDQMERTLT